MPAALFSVGLVQEWVEGILLRKLNPTEHLRHHVRPEGARGPGRKLLKENFCFVLFCFFLLNYHVLQEVGYTMVHF